MMRRKWFGIVLSAAALVGIFAMTGRAQIAVVPTDNKVVLVNGVQTIVKNPAPDRVTLVDLGTEKIVAEMEGVPCSVIGPPLSVAVTPDGGLALVTACMKIDPADPTKQTEDNRVSVIDLSAKPPKVIATVEVGKGPAGISIDRTGTLALVANRGEGTVSALSINGSTVTNWMKVDVGNAASALGHVAFTPDGKRALVTRDGDNMVSVLSIAHEKTQIAFTYAGGNIRNVKDIGTLGMTLAGRDIRTGFRPYAIDVTPDGTVAVVANVGPGNGDVDTLGVIDLKADPPRMVDSVAVAPTPEGMKISADGKWVAVVSHDGSNKPKESPFHHDHGKLQVLRLEGTKLTKVAEAEIGHWSQGVAFSSDGNTIAVCNMMEKELQMFHFDGKVLTDGGRIPLKGGPVAIRIAE